MTASLTRREILTGTIDPDRVASAGGENEHISSAVISVLPPLRTEVEARLQALPGAEIYHRSESKLVVVLEGSGSGALGTMLAEISGWHGVLSANMVFEQRLEQER